MTNRTVSAPSRISGMLKLEFGYTRLTFDSNFFEAVKVLYRHSVKQRGPNAGQRANFGTRIITVISVITIGLPCVPKIPNMSGNNITVQTFAQM